MNALIFLKLIYLNSHTKALITKSFINKIIHKVKSVKSVIMSLSFSKEFKKQIVYNINLISLITTLQEIQNLN